MNRTTEHLLLWNTKVKERQESKREAEDKRRIKDANTPRMSKGTIKMVCKPYTRIKKLTPAEEVRNKLNEYLKRRPLKTAQTEVVPSVDLTQKDDEGLAIKPCERTMVKVGKVKVLKENMFIRNEQWMTNKKLKIQRLRQIENNKCMNGCTFSPRLFARRLID